MAFESPELIDFYRIKKEDTVGTGATTLDYEYRSKKPIHAILATMKFLQNGATLETIAEYLTQFATNLIVQQDGKDMFKMSATRLHQLLTLGMPNGWSAMQTDGTGADNQYHAGTLLIPLAPFDLPVPIHPEFGLDPEQGIINISLEVPADGNKIDARVMTIQTLTIRDATPDKFIRRVKRHISSPAAAENQYLDMPNGDGLSLYDHYIFQTTGLTAGTTSDVVTVDEISFEKDQTKTILDDLYSLSAQFNLRNLSLLATSPAVASTGIYLNPNQLGKFNRSIPLDTLSRYNFTCEDTNTLEVYSGVIRPNMPPV